MKNNTAPSVVKKVSKIKLDVCDESQRLGSDAVNFHDNFTCISLQAFESAKAEKYRSNLDLPGVRSFVDMGLQEKSYIDIRQDDIGGVPSYQDVEIRPIPGADIQNRLIRALGFQMQAETIRVPCRAGGMDRAHFTENCVQYGGSLYRIEQNTENDLTPKNHKIESWLWVKADNDKERYQLAARWVKVVKGLEIDSQTIRKMTDGVKFHKKGLRVAPKEVQESALAFLEMLVSEMPVLDNEIAVPYVDDTMNGIDDSDIPLDEVEHEDYHGGEWTAKKLDNGYSSLSHAAIMDIQAADRERYLEINQRFWSNEYDGMRQKLTPSAVSQGFGLLKEKRIELKRALYKKVKAEGLPPSLVYALREHRLNPTKQSRYRILIHINGGVFDGVQVSKISKNAASVAWDIINKYPVVYGD